MGSFAALLRFAFHFAIHYVCQRTDPAVPGLHCPAMRLPVSGQMRPRGRIAGARPGLAVQIA
jgi:hypothetical protein